jgi:hypothetical protein
MESSTLTQQELGNFKNLADVILLCSASAGGVSTTDILSSKKTKEITIARGVAIAIMHEQGLSIREIARISDTDPKGVHTYVHSHDNRMADKRYSRVFNRANEFMKGYFSSDTSLHGEVDKLKQMYVDLNGKYEHLKELLTSN